MKIFLAGAEKIDWALNEDIRLLQTSLENAGASIAASLDEADVVHSPWWGGLEEIDPSRLAGKRVVCQFDNPPFHWAKQAGFRDARARVGLWIVQSEQARLQALALGLEHVFVPYKVNTEIFRSREAEARASLRASLGIPAGAYVIGNFHRDTDGSDLKKPKLQKGPDLFLEVLVQLRTLGAPIHALLAGPRRHWLRAKLREHGVPFTFAGETRQGDDIKVNVLPRARVAELYHALDLCLVTSRWEGGPYSPLEAAASGIPVLSTHVGIAEDLLEPDSLFENLGEAVARVAEERASGTISRHRDSYAMRVEERFTTKAVRPHVEAYLARLPSVKPYSPSAGNAPKALRAPSILDRARRKLGLGVKPYAGLTVSIFREFVNPPYGGGNQFMLALKDAFEKKGVRVLVNEISEHVDGYFFDSLWFVDKLLDRLESMSNPVVVHRVDGPIQLYRDKDKELDDKIFAINERLATTTVIQSDFTLEKVFETGYRPVRPVVIRNAANPAIFFPRERDPVGSHRKTRIIASSWSDNPKKGGPFYKWLEENLDWSRYEFTFVGRCSETLTKARMIGPVASEQLAALLNEHDVYIMASKNDSCPNALIEAMSCGLPAVVLRSGGQPELVGFGGLCFDTKEEIPALLDEITARHESYCRLLQPPCMDDVAERYLELVRKP
jgi:glycosyltransferase involved in cell wall biosynthesis